MRQGIFQASLAMALFVCGGVNAEPAMDPALREKAGRAADAGLHYLREHQAEDGSWSESVGVTALALRAFLESHRGYNEGDGAFITRPISFIMANVRDDGSISETAQKRNYNTAVSLTALAATNNSEYATTIGNGQKFLQGLQLDEPDGYEPDHKYYGGIGYGGDERPDLSNQYMALEALKATATDEDDPVWEKALTFVSRAQNYSETNDQEWAGNDGGFVYMPGYSPHEGLNSYGGMTSAGLLSLLFAGADKSDPRVKAAYDWIRANYTLEENPGAGKQGLYYYYNVFAKCMYVYGENEIVDSNGVAHNWRDDLARKLISLQQEDGSWFNPDSPRWWEGNKDLVTAWSVIALNSALRD
jgi:squalene-hopene/tetraprenyl-beta-curcumene cyclase